MYTALSKSMTLLGALLMSLPLAAADDSEPGCPLNADGMAAEVKRILGPRYATSADDAVALDQSFRDLEILMLRSGHCSASARAHENAHSDDERESNIREWHTLNQWLDRLVGRVRRTVKGDPSLSWRDEYVLFAEVYEFEP